MARDLALIGQAPDPKRGFETTPIPLRDQVARNRFIDRGARPMIKVIGDATEGTPLDRPIREQMGKWPKPGERWKHASLLLENFPTEILFPPSPPLSDCQSENLSIWNKFGRKKFIAFDRNKSFQVWEESVYTCVYIRMQLATEAEHFQNYKRTSGANKILEIR